MRTRIASVILGTFIWLGHLTDVAHLGLALLYAAVALYFLSFFAAIELALLRLPT